MTIDSYELATHDVGGIYFIPDNLFFFHDHFVCEPMMTSWQAPPFRPVRKRAKPADFSSWMLAAPVVRERVREILDSVCGDDLEFLPFYTTPRGEELFAMNVLTSDCSRPVFKKARLGPVYVRQQFGVLAVEHEFTGLALADPNANNLGKIVRGQDINVFPGLRRH